MFKRNWLTFLFLFLAVLNIVLFVAYRARLKNLNAAQVALSQAQGIDGYITAGEHDMEYVVRELPEFLPASLQFRQAIDTIRLLLKEPTSPTDYFSAHLAVPPDVQAKLRDVQAAYKGIIVQYLETDVATATGEYRRLVKDAEEQFAAIERKAASSGTGLWTAPIKLQMTPEHVLATTIRWSKRDDSVRWKNRAYFDNYVSRLSEKATATHARQCRRLVQKLDEAFDVPGKLLIYNDRYDLDHLTAAELESVCRYLSVLKTEIEISLSSVIQDIRRF